MLSIGFYAGGPEQATSGFRKAFVELSKMIDVFFARGHAVDSAGINVVYYWPGSVWGFEEVKDREVKRFSRKKRLVLITRTVNAEIGSDAIKSFDFLVSSLEEANDLAFIVFKKKGLAGYDRGRMSDIICDIRKDRCIH